MKRKERKKMQDLRLTVEYKCMAGDRELFRALFVVELHLFEPFEGNVRDRFRVRAAWSTRHTFALDTGLPY